VLRRKLATTVQRVARNVKRWRGGDQPLRCTATGLWGAEKKFRRIKGYQEILLLKERLNPSRTWFEVGFTVPNIVDAIN
jgi:hypothetical protein